MKKKIRIMVVDDHFVVRMGLAGSINIEPDMTVEARGLQRPASHRTFSASIARILC